MMNVLGLPPPPSETPCGPVRSHERIYFSLLQDLECRSVATWRSLTRLSRTLASTPALPHPLDHGNVRNASTFSVLQSLPPAPLVSLEVTNAPSPRAYPTS